jgi:hypothetical protein
MELNDERKAYLIERLAFRDPLPQIKQDYEKLFMDKVSGEDLMRFRNVNKSLISKVADRELNNIRMEALAHTRIRLRILHNAIQEASIPKPVRSVPARSDGKVVEYEVSYEQNYNAISSLVKVAQNEEFFNKKLFLEIKKMQLSPGDVPSISQSGFSVIPIRETGELTLVKEE